jgi:hypothetical protein
MGRLIDRDYKLLSGHSMPVLGLGTWGLAGSACERIVSKALELGYRHIDTAQLYGDEAEIGRASVFLTSKVASENLRPDDVLWACTGSLERLGSDYLDLYLIHWPNDEIPIEETMDAMQSLVEQGMVRYDVYVGVEHFHEDSNDQLRKIAPKRFNPQGEAWLPVLNAKREGWSFTALYSNTATAHRLGKTHDWVVIYYEKAGGQRQGTVVTAEWGRLAGERVVRGRERECREHYGG